MALVLSSVNEWLAQAQAAWQTFAEAFKNALDEGKVGTEAAARNKYLAVGAGSLVAVAGYLYVRKALHLTAEDYANQRRKTTVQLKLKPAHAAALKDITAKYHFKDQSKALRMAIDYANQEVDSDAIYTAQHISAVGELPAEETSVVLDKESHVEWLVKMKQSQDLQSLDQALAVVLDYIFANPSENSTIFEIDRTNMRPIHGQPSLIISIKS